MSDPEVDRKPQPAPTRPTPWFTVFLIAACVALCGLVVVQQRSLRGLEDQVRLLSEQIGRGSLPIGEIVAPLDTFTSSGAAASPSAGEAPLAWNSGRLATIVYLFNRNCAACGEVRPQLDPLAQAFSGVGVRFVAVQLDATEPSSIEPPTPGVPPTLETVGVAMNRGTWLARVSLVPSILLVDTEGRVLGAWYGVPVPAHWAQMRQALEKLTRTGR